MIIVHIYGHLSQINIRKSLKLMSHEPDVPNKNDLMMSFAAIYFSCCFFFSWDNIAND